jgi:hypothetical protein
VPMIDCPLIRSVRAGANKAKRANAGIGFLLVVLMTSGGLGLAGRCKGAPDFTSTAKDRPAATGTGTLWLGLKLRGAPIDPVAAGLNYAEQIGHDLDLTFHPAIKPQGAWSIFSARLHSMSAKKVVSYMPVVIPRADIDRAMPVIKPDPSIDFELIVKTPAVEAANQLDARESVK